MKRNLIIINLALLAIGMTSCQKNEIIENSLSGKQVTITVAMPTVTPDTKTVLDATEMVAKWVTGDEISVLYASNPAANVKFTLNPEDNGKSIGRFTGTFPTGEGAPVNGEDYYLCYPYQTNPVLTTTGGLKIAIDYPAVQGNTSNGFSQNVMVGLSREDVTTPAQMQNSEQDFDNISALLKVSIKGTGTLSKIFFNDLTGKPVNGRISIEADGEGPHIVFPAAATESSQTFLTYDLGTGVALTSAAQTFYLTVPGRNYTKGYRVVFQLSDGKQMILTAGSASGKELEMGSYYTAPEVTFAETPNKLFYQGVVYNIKQLLDGRVWMCENLRYVPAGMTVSSTPSDDNGIYYPAGLDKTALTDTDSIAAKGLLYNSPTAFGVPAITKDNFSTFTGVQGICPNGWHIPTSSEIVNLVGRGLKDQVDDVPTAPYYNPTTKKSSIALANADGFNISGNAYVRRDSTLYTGVYNGNPVNGKFVMDYIMGSSVKVSGGVPTYTPRGAGDPTPKVVQYYAIMPNLAGSNEALNLAINNYLNAVHVRCIKNVD